MTISSNSIKRERFGGLADSAFVKSKLAPLHLLLLLQFPECVEAAWNNSGDHLKTFVEREIVLFEFLFQLVRQKRRTGAEYSVYINTFKVL